MVLDSEERPWGSWHVIDVADGYKIKRIHVNPGARLSLPDATSTARSTGWSSTAIATCEIDGADRSWRVTGESIDVPLGAKHRLGNEGTEELVIVEVQLGGYTGEDDIVRLRGRLQPSVIAQLPLLIIPAPTVTPVASSIRMNEPVVRFFE